MICESVCVLVKVPMNGLIILMDWTQQECSWSYVSFCYWKSERPGSFIESTLGANLEVLVDDLSLVSGDAELGFLVSLMIESFFL
jgi:hypothetical protein